MLVLIDGNHMAHRAFHATAPLTRQSDGFPVGAILGFSQMLFAMVGDPWFQDVSHAAVIWDAGGKTWRHDLFPAYKAGRKHPDDLGRQYPALRRAAEAFGFASVEQPGVEADDIIATYAHQHLGLTVIVSSDKDLLQLVDEGWVSLYDTMKQGVERWTGPQQVFDRWGVWPEDIPDLLALMGDAADNVPGIPGVGPVKAAKLIDLYGTVAEIVMAAQNNRPGWPYKALRSVVAAAEDTVTRAERLVTLDRDVLLTGEVEDMRCSPRDVNRLVNFLEEYGFFDMKRRVNERWRNVDA